MKYKENYEIFENGNVFSYKSNKIMTPFNLGGNNNKYLGVSINRKPEYVHRIVAKCFLDTFNEILQVNHKDGNKSNNNINNLEMLTASENVKHSYDVLGRVGRPFPYSKMMKNN